MKTNLLLLTFFCSLFMSAVGQESQYPSAVFKQTNLGDIYNVNPIDVAIHPQNSNIVIVATHAGLYKTIDKGHSWRLLNVIDEPNEWLSVINTGQFDAVEFNPDNAELFASGIGGFYYSTDAGETWEIKRAPYTENEDNINYISFGNDNSTLYMSGFSKVYKSTDKGNTMTTIADFGGSIEVGSGNALGIITMDGYAIITENEFADYDTIDTPIPTHYEYIYDEFGNLTDSVLQYNSTYSIQCFLLDYYDENIILMGVHDYGYLRSTDKGQTWTRIRSNETIGINGFEVDPKNENVIYSGREYDVLKSSDKGETWSRVYDGAGNAITLSKAAISVSSDEVWFVNSADLVFKNEEDKWSVASDSGIFNNQIAEISVSDDYKNIVCLDIAGHFQVSSDSGQTWEKIIPHSNELGESHGRIVATTDIEHTSTQDLMYLTGWGHSIGTLFKSIDGGDSWLDISPFDYGDGGIAGSRIESNPLQPAIIYVNSLIPDSSMFKSEDSGLTWKAIKNGLNGQIIDFVINDSHPDTLYALGDQRQIYKTVNGGENWTYLTTFDCEYLSYLSINPYNPEEVFAIMNEGSMFFYTTDGGNTWDSYAIESSFHSKMYFSSNGNGITEYYISMNGGIYCSTDTLKTWKLIANNGFKGYSPITKVGGKLFAGQVDGENICYFDEYRLDSISYNPTVNCVYDSSTVLMHPAKDYIEAIFSIDKGITTQPDSAFENISIGTYYPVMIIGNDTLSLGEISIEANQNNFVDIGDDSTITTEDEIFIDAGSGFESYLWNSGGNTQIIEISGSDIGEGAHSIWVTAIDEFSCHSSDTITLTVTPTTAIESLYSVNVEVYPNPASDIIHIKCDNLCKVQLLDLKGNVLITKQIKDKQLTFNLSKFSSGTYIIKLKAGNKILSKKIIKR